MSPISPCRIVAVPPTSTVIFVVFFSFSATDLASLPPTFLLSLSSEDLLSAALPLESAAAEATFFTLRSSSASTTISPVTTILRSAAPFAIVAFVSALNTVMATLPAMPTLFAPAPAMAWVSTTYPVAFACSASSATPPVLTSLLMAALVRFTSAFCAPFFRASEIFPVKSVWVRL